MLILLGAPSSSPPPLAMGGSKKKVDPKEAKAAAKAKAEKRQASGTHAPPPRCYEAASLGLPARACAARRARATRRRSALG